ncbi:hypothetical protein [Coraliomargarita parva]|uniref:hypothetical protein n=1 Tax=Coraliomargarita parva TaxID=3014050 RepID=UPI0022B4779F|nr:hypothetical protein [Coraliomargarita parva]
MNQKTEQIIGRFLAALLVLNLVVFFGSGDFVDENKTYGMAMFWATFFSWSLLLFWMTSLRYSKVTNKKVSYTIARLAVAYSFLQIPIWCIISKEFPPENFSLSEALLLTLGAVFGLFGPAAPLISSFLSRLSAANAEQHRQIKIKKSNKAG